jgi:hypothetical protein
MNMNHFSAGVEWKTGKVYLFRGGQYIRVDPTTNRADAGYPKSIAGSWPGLFERDIDAALLWNNGKAYFFKGNQYVRYDVASDRVDAGYPKPIAGSWPGLFERDIDAALLWNNRKAYFFKGNQYVRYDVASDRVDAGYPKSIAGSWPGLFANGLDDAFHWIPGKVIFLRGGEYVVYDIAADRADPGYPKPLPETWFGVQDFPNQPTGPHTGADPVLPEASWRALAPRERLVQCCRDILAAGPMGHNLRGEFYRRFINCGMSPAIKVGNADVEDLSPVKTSCAIFVRAIHHWCGRTAQKSIPSAGIFNYLRVSQSHPAWVRFAGHNRPNPGDTFFVASKADGTDGHVGIFLRESEPDVWETAEGGGNDGPGGAEEGTLCRLSSQNVPTFARSLRPGGQFDPFVGRPLRGWFDCDKLGFPPAD